MNAITIVFLKEALENLRDRRVVFSAFFFGVLLAPAIFALTTTLVSKRAIKDQEQPLSLPVIGANRAPNLMHFLAGQGGAIKPVHLSASDALSKVRDGEFELVLIVRDDYAKRLAAGESAPLDLVLD